MGPGDRFDTGIHVCFREHAASEAGAEHLCRCGRAYGTVTPPENVLEVPVTPEEAQKRQGGAEWRDPAIEAAKQAIGGHHWWMTRLDDRTVGQLSDYGIAAAREALRPVRDAYEKFERVFGGHDSLHASGVRLVLAELAPFIYASEELNQ